MAGSVQQEPFGKTKDGRNVTRYTLKNSSGRLVVRIIDYGGIITDILVPDRDGKVSDINLGYDDIASYEVDNQNLGALIGRVANNITGGKFVMDGQEYVLNLNRPPNCVHGGFQGFDKKLWSSRVDGDKLVLQYVSPDGEEKFPGELTTTVTYRVTDADELFIDYEATTTKTTPANFTNHAYFNLAGHDARTLDDHIVTIHADAYLPIHEGNPTGEIRNVEGTEWDLRKPVRLGDRLAKVPGGEGFGHNFCLRPSNDTQTPRLAARVDHPPSGRYMECWTTEPGLQFYTSYHMKYILGKGKGGTEYKPFGAFCLEAQHYPDSVNHSNFPSIILKPGETYRQTTFYKFGVA